MMAYLGEDSFDFTSASAVKEHLLNAIAEVRLQ